MPQRRKERHVEATAPAKSSVSNVVKKSVGRKTPSGKTICLAMIVKNESKNMVRLLKSLESVIDFISIVDTGSTDSTVEIISKWGQQHKIPTTVHSHEWKNFGYNRTRSVKMAQQTYPQADYLLLSDADFVWEVNTGGKFDKRLLYANSYMVDQYNDTIRYGNLRLLSNKLEWECVGVTHEFWRSSSELVVHAKIKTLTIHDIGDGGCKGDKLERDERLLRAGLVDPITPNDLKIRYKFYLAQTLMDSGQYEESASWYKERAGDGGFWEEVYYSLYRVGECYEKIGWNLKHVASILEREALAGDSQTDSDSKGDSQTEGNSQETVGEGEIQAKDQTDSNTQTQSDANTKSIQRWNPNHLNITDLLALSGHNFDEAGKYYILATQYNPKRAEALYAMTRLLRSLGLNERSLQMAEIGRKIPYPKDETLFVQHAVYSYLFDYEISITAFYVEGKRDSGRDACLKLLEMDDLPDYYRKQVEDNTRFYL